MADSMKRIVEVEDLDVTGEERQAGASEAYAIHVKRLTIVVLEAADGVMAAGLHAAWPGSRTYRAQSLEKARGRAILNLDKALVAQRRFASERQGRW